MCNCIYFHYRMSLRIEVLDVKQKQICVLDAVPAASTVKELKKLIAAAKPRLSQERQSIRVEPKGKGLKDDQKVGDLKLSAGNAQVFVKDLGPQIAWKTVFLTEYAGPFFIYPLFYFRPSFIYGADASKPVHPAVTLACICWSIHYAKRLLETQFVHRFSNGTMPQFNLIKNCSYYWGFCAFVSYFVNHPLFTPPAFGAAQMYLGLAGFAIAELGNLSIHLLFRNLRPEGTTTRQIPKPDSNPLTGLFNLVSCPNYTYEVAAWLSFSVMCQSLPALLFTTAGFIQMAIWAKNKHRAYKKEFSDYPKQRKAIVPFFI